MPFSLADPTQPMETPGGLSLYGQRALKNVKESAPAPAPPRQASPAVPPQLAAAVQQVESGGRTGLVSSAGALGTMQVLPATARAMGVTNLKDQGQLKKAGEQYLGQLLTQFKGDTTKALAAYNWGPTRVENLIKRKGEEWHLHLPAMVKDYLGKVSSFMGGMLSPAEAGAAEPPGRPSPASLTDAQLMARIGLPQRGAPGGAAGPADTRPPSALTDAELMARIQGAGKPAAPAAGAPAPPPAGAGGEWDMETPGAAAPPGAGGLLQNLLGQMAANADTEAVKQRLMGEGQALPSPGQMATNAAQAVVGQPGMHGEAIGQVVGGLVGAPLGKVASGLGTVAGGMVGALGDQYFNPVTGEPLGSHMLGAAGRGLGAALLGQALESTAKGVTGLVTAPGKTKIDIPTKERFESFQRHGFEHMTPAMVTQSDKQAMMEAVVSGDILGLGVRAETIEGITREGAAAMQAAIGKAIPGISNDYAALAVGLQAAKATNKLAQIGRNAKAFQQPAIEIITKREQEMRAQQIAQGQGPYAAAAYLTAARQQGIKAANVVFDVMNNVWSHDLRAPTTHIQEAVDALRRTSSRSSQYNARVNQLPPGQATTLGGLTKEQLQAQLPKGFDQLPPAGQDQYLRQLTGVATPGAPAPLPVHLQTPPPGATKADYRAWVAERRAWQANQAAQQPMLSSLDDAFKEMELNPDATTMTYDQLKFQATNNLSLAETSANAQTRIAAQRIGEAARKDLAALTDGNPAAEKAMEAAHAMYKNEYLDVFIKSPEAADLAKYDPSELVNRWFDKDITVEGLARMQKLVGPAKAREFQLATMQKLVTDSVVPGTENMFSIPTFLTKIGKFKPGVLQRVGGADWPLLKEVVDRLRDIHLTYRSALNPSGTAPRSQAHALMMGTAKLAAYAAIGAGSGLLGGQVHIPINPIISAATGILVPTLGAHLWFTPKYLKFWVEGLNINPHARNAALLFNRWGSKVAAAYAVDQMRGANEDEVLPTIPPPRSRVPQGDVLSTIPPPRRR